MNRPRILGVCLQSACPFLWQSCELMKLDVGVWKRAQGAAPSEAWAALGGFLLATLLHWAAAKLKVAHYITHLNIWMHAPATQRGGLGHPVFA